MVTIRPATKFDAVACAGIYRWYVENTAITFEYDAPTAAQVELRMDSASATHAWFVALDGADVVGYAYGAPFRERAAYRWAVETAVYVARDRPREGIGGALYDELLPRLAERGYRRAIAGVTLPNPASVALHLRCGFAEVGVHRRVGWKLEAWHDVLFLQRDLGPATEPPAPPR